MVFVYGGLTRFEKTRIISARALQISMGAPVLVKTSMDSPRSIAQLEFQQNVLPITVKRTMPQRAE